MHVERTIPVFRIFDEAKAREFYCGFLGFTVDWEHRFAPDNTPLYMQVSRDGITLHLSEHHGDGTPGSHAVVWADGIDAYQQELLAKNYKYLRPHISDDPWGRTLVLIDPFKNNLLLLERAQREN